MSPTKRDQDSGEFGLDPEGDFGALIPISDRPGSSPSEEDFAALRLALGAAERPQDLTDAEHLNLIESVLGIDLRASDSTIHSAEETAASDSSPFAGHAGSQHDRLRDEPTPHSIAEAEAPVAEAERLDAQRLARALDGLENHALADLAFELREAHRPQSLSPIAEERALASLQSHALERGQVLPFLRGNGAKSRNRGTWVLATSTVLAIAAGWALILRSSPSISSREPTATSPLALSRSAEPLLETAQYWQRGTTERIDRIAVVRSRELRRNRYLNWRVR
ncbi:MAG: hypothetical protein QM784_36555 [Polyangiaceae bacterium]